MSSSTSASWSLKWVWGSQIFPRKNSKLSVKWKGPFQELELTLPASFWVWSRVKGVSDFHPKNKVWESRRQEPSQGRHLADTLLTKQSRLTALGISLTDIMSWEGHLASVGFFPGIYNHKWRVRKITPSKHPNWVILYRIPDLYLQKCISPGEEKLEEWPQIAADQGDMRTNGNVGSWTKKGPIVEKLVTSK